MTSQCIGTSKLINTLVSERNMCSYHRYDGPIGQYPAQRDFSDGAATNRHFREVCSSQHPQKISNAAKATFLDGKKFGFMQIRSLSKKLHGRQQPRCEGGGSPSSNFLAYSQLDEMSHIYISHMYIYIYVYIYIPAGAHIHPPGPFFRAGAVSDVRGTQILKFRGENYKFLNNLTQKFDSKI